MLIAFRDAMVDVANLVLLDDSYHMLHIDQERHKVLT